MPRSRDFPELCAECGRRGLNPARIQHQATVKHDGSEHTLDIPDLNVEQCRFCGATFFGNQADDQISRALRHHLHLLQPEQIRECRAWLDLKQAQIADDIGAAPESLSRWENGRVIQSRGTDRFLRAYFTLPELRSFLRRLGNEPYLGCKVISHDL